MIAPPLIALEEIEVWQTDFSGVLIESVTWAIGPGEFWVVAGLAGSGRSALLATAAGLQRPGGGRLRLFGRELADATEEEQVDWRRRIGFVYEHGGRLLNNLTIRENIALPLAYHLDLAADMLAAKVDELLATAGLESIAATLPSRVGPRLQQRAALMRALAVPSEVLFVDNPAGGLGPREARWWVETLERLRREPGRAGAPLAVVVSTDHFQVWRDTADRFAVLREGVFQVVGGREEVLASTDQVVREFN